jgi:hypothetical protein
MTPRIAFAPGAALVRRTVQTSLAVVALTCGTGAAAFAQTVPAAPLTVTAPIAADSAAPSTVAQATPAPSTVPAPTAPTAPTAPPAAPVRPAPPPFSHAPIIDFVATFTQPAYYGSSANIRPYDPIDLGGTFRIPITRKFNLLFDRITEGTINQPLECVRQTVVVGGVAHPGTQVCPNNTRDILLQYHATYAFDRFWTLDVGDSFRHRIYAGGVNGASGVSTVPFLCNNNGQSTGANCTQSSTEHHFAYVGLSYTTRPIKELLRSTFIFTLTGDAQNVDHHVGTTASCKTQPAPPQAITCGAGAINYLDENTEKSRYYESTQGVSMIVPVDIRHGTTLLLNERWGALNFYENAVVPYRWNSAFTAQINKRFSPGFTLSMRHSDYHAIPQGSATLGAPFLFPNAIHVGSWDVIGTFHVDTGTWFHL